MTKFLAVVTVYHVDAPKLPHGTWDDVMMDDMMYLAPAQYRYAGAVPLMTELGESVSATLSRAFHESQNDFHEFGWARAFQNCLATEGERSSSSGDLFRYGGRWYRARRRGGFMEVPGFAVPGTPAYEFEKHFIR